MSNATINPYETLGVPSDADDDAIKSAYRKKAKELHPDSNGGSDETADAFLNTTRSYKLLTDQSARKHFDETGEWPEDHNVVLNPLQEKALTFLAKMMMEAIQAPSDPNFFDMRGMVKARLQEMAEENRKQAAAFNVQAERVTRLLKKFRIKEGQSEPLLMTLLSAQRKGLQKVRDDFQDIFTACSVAVAILDKYDFSPELPPNPFGVTVTGPTSFNSFKTNSTR